MEINPFIICNTAEQATYRQYADQQSWHIACLALGAVADMLYAFDTDAQRYAATTIYPNSDVVAYCRQLAKEALLRGEPMPATAKGAIEAENRRQTQRIVERFNLG